jgi:hypothetical protein
MTDQPNSYGGYQRLKGARNKKKTPTSADKIPVRGVCSVQARLSQEDHDWIRDETKTDREFGGNFVLDPWTNELRLNKTAYGGLDSVDVERGLVEFHSHPTKCQGDECALGVPSPADIGNIAIGAIHGNQFHLLYSSDGIHVLSLSDRVRKGISTESGFRAYIKRYIPKLYDLYLSFIDDELSYHEFRRKYLKIVRDMGINMEERPLSTHRPPELELDVPCSLRKPYKGPDMKIPRWFDDVMSEVEPDNNLN